MFVGPNGIIINLFRCATTIAAFIQGSDDRGRMIRRTLVRYLNLMAVLTLQGISTVIKRRFPSDEHLVQAGGLFSIFFIEDALVRFWEFACASDDDERSFFFFIFF